MNTVKQWNCPENVYFGCPEKYVTSQVWSLKTISKWYTWGWLLDYQSQWLLPRFTRLCLVKSNAKITLEAWPPSSMAFCKQFISSFALKCWLVWWQDSHFLFWLIVLRREWRHVRVEMKNVPLCQVHILKEMPKMKTKTKYVFAFCTLKGFRQSLVLQIIIKLIILNFFYYFELFVEKIGPFPASFS